MAPTALTRVKKAKPSLRGSTKRAAPEERLQCETVGEQTSNGLRDAPNEKTEQKEKKKQQKKQRHSPGAADAAGDGRLGALPHGMVPAQHDAAQEVAAERRSSRSGAQEESRFDLERGAHPLGIQPMGNMLLSSARFNARDVGLGCLRLLPDAMLLDIFELLDARDLCQLAACSRALYVMSSQDDLWRQQTVACFGGRFEFRGNWKGTFRDCMVAAKRGEGGGGQEQPSREEEEGNGLARIKVCDFFSDHLFQSWLCASLQLHPSWLATDNIPRRGRLSVEEFREKFELPNRPVILTGAISHWPALARWSREYIMEESGSNEFSAGPIQITAQRYFRYADAAEEERPLYIFDPQFVEKVPRLGEDYQVPEYFQEDLFSVLGRERPDYRWLIIGPKRSGSSWHIDPNQTSAWNAVVRGRKKWILFPPGDPPPGVLPSADGADVASPVAITEWFMNFYRQLRQSGERAMEGVCGEGEVIFVPHGWWHTVINVEESVAITQNYVSRSNLLDVLDFLSRPNACDLVSGTSDRASLHDRFQAKLEERHPGLIAQLRHEAEEKKRKQAMASQFWDNASDSVSGGFRFGF